MKNAMTTTWDQLKGDRTLIILIGLITVLGLLYSVFVALSVSPTELQVATRYTAFGGTQYYRNKWYYLLSFILFGLVMTFVHISLVMKLKSRNMRSLAVSMGWLAIILLFILFLVTRSVLGVAYLS